jgi:hypothetical protein
MRFSILHPTIRLPQGWMLAANAWLRSADNWREIEYILVTDDCTPLQLMPRDVITRIVNTGRHCYVDAQNAAARYASGDFLVTAADDWFPPPHWDTGLLRLVPDPLTAETVIKVHADHHPDLIIYPIMTRAYYERPGRGGCPRGELFYPEYLSMGSDDDLTEYATRDGVVIEAPDMHFEHRHPSLGNHEFDDGSYEHGHSDEAWAVKERVLAWRRSENFAR